MAKIKKIKRVDFEGFHSKSLRLIDIKNAKVKNTPSL
jgi:hypothetical protein